MNKLFFLLVFIVSCTASRSTMSSNNGVVNVASFGIVGDGKTNNTNSFRSLSQYLEGKKDLTIVFDPGTYVVGKQTKSESQYLKGSNVLTLKNCSNIVIKGNNASIIYKNSLKYGSFTPETGKVFKSPNKGHFSKRKYAASIGNCISVLNSTNIVISDLTLNGSINKAIIGGKWGDAGIQLVHVGIKIMESKNIQLVRNNISYFGLDGIYIKNKNPKNINKGDDNIIIDSCMVSYNGRQGLSWTSGIGLILQNSSFNYTGQGGVFSPPCSGFDIEPHSGMTCSNATIKNCNFIGNGNSGFVSDRNPNRIVFNIQFEDCKFIADKKTAAFPRNGSISFTDCMFDGPVMGIKGGRKNHPLKFENCLFTDSIFNKLKSYGNYLLNADRSQYLTIQNCTFRTFYRMPLYMSAVKSVTLDGRPKLIKNKFHFYYNEPINKKWLAIIRGSIMTDNLFIDNMSDDYVTFINTNGNNIYKGRNEIITSRPIGFGKIGSTKKLIKQ